jgi:Amt family ammonium transporter
MPLTGLFYGGGMTLLKAQLIGSVVVTFATFSVALVLMYAVHMMGVLRVSKEGEDYGLDLHEHGISAYPEYVISSIGRPTGMPAEPAVAAAAAQQVSRLGLSSSSGD